MSAWSTAPDLTVFNNSLKNNVLLIFDLFKSNIILNRGFLLVHFFGHCDVVFWLHFLELGHIPAESRYSQLFAGKGANFAKNG